MIDGATINDNVVGGGYAYGSGSETAVKSASLTISNAELGSSGKEVNVYAGGVASANAKSSSVESALLQITATKVLCTQAVPALTVRSARAALL